MAPALLNSFIVFHWQLNIHLIEQRFGGRNGSLRRLKERRKRGRGKGRELAGRELLLSATSSFKHNMSDFDDVTFV